MKQADFYLAHTFTAEWEGGLTDHPADPGGITNYGVSIRWLKSLGLKDGDIDHDGAIDADDIRKLTKEQAAGLFKAKFWDKHRLGEFSQLAATVYYDSMVNTGYSQSTKFMQRGFNEAFGKALVDDGALGPLTRKAIRQAGDAPAFLIACLDEREQFYRNLVASKPGYQPFLKGWLNRNNALRRFCGVSG